MTELSSPPGMEESNIVPLYLDDAPEVDNLVYGNFQPDTNRREGLRRIGELTMSITLTYTRPGGTLVEIKPGYGEIASSDPIYEKEDKKGNIKVLFKQHWYGYRGDGYGIPHRGYGRPGDNGYRLETIRLLEMCWNVRTQSVEAGYVHPRNFRYAFADYEAAIRRDGGQEELEALRKDLWENWQE